MANTNADQVSKMIGLVWLVIRIPKLGSVYLMKKTYEIILNPMILVDDLPCWLLNIPKAHPRSMKNTP